MKTGVNEVLTRTGLLYGGDIKMDQTLSGALSEEGVQQIFGQRLRLGTDTGKAAWWLHGGAAPARSTVPCEQSCL